MLGKALAGRPVYPGREVQHSVDFARVASLPRRPPVPPGADVVAALTRRLARDPHRPTMTLRPIQAWALSECEQSASMGRGLLCPMGVGSGKTLVSALAPVFYPRCRPVLFTYASLYEKTVRELGELAAHWRIPETTVRTWESLSRPDAADLLARLNPTLVVADEVHAVKEPMTARTMRFLRFFETHPDVPLVALSGTITSQSLGDFAHLAALCLGNLAPVPLDPQVVADWGLALDTGVVWNARKEPGVLSAWMEPGEKGPREGFRRRLVESHGVVATSADALGTSLDITPVKAAPGPALAECVRAVEGTGLDPDGNELEDPAALARVVKAVSTGYWLRWAWPGGEVDAEWLAARNGWARACRSFFTEGAAAGLDSPALLAAACQAGTPPTWALGEAWARWKPLSHRPAPPVVARYNRDAVHELAQYVKGWAKHGGGIVWVPSPSVGDALARTTDFHHFCAGLDPSTSKKSTIIASVQAHGVGKNLQRWHRNLVLVPPSSGKTWEQLLGRTHRPGQTADAVQVTVFTWNDTLKKAWARARDEALYIQQVTGSPQKLVAATITEV